MSRDRELLEVDVLIVGGGPAGLAAAFHLKSLMTRLGRDDVVIAVLDKGREIGSHIMSGAVLDPRAIAELLPDWIERGAPVEGPVRKDELLFMTSGSSFRFPVTPPPLRNDGCYVVSLNRFVRWFGGIVEDSGVDLLSGFAGSEILMEGDRVVGVRTGDKGRDRERRPKANFEPGVDVRAKVTVLAEGVRGSLTRGLVERLGLAEGRNPQVYSIGVKEVWEVPGSPPPGHVIHTMGFPLSSGEFGGGFVYTMADRRVAVGLVVGLDYRNPTLDPYERFQAFKTHPFMRNLLDGGTLAGYGAKAIPEGGYWSIPRCSFDGGLVIGDAAGFLNSMRLKGIHLAIKSGMIAAQVIAKALVAGDCSAATLGRFDAGVQNSWIRDELWKVRNFHQGFRGGLWSGMAHAALQMVTGGRGVRTRYPSEPGHERMRKLGDLQAAARSADQRVRFDDRLTDVHSSGTHHEEDQPSHLVITAPETCYPRCTREFGNPCQYFCPAAVYEMAPGHTGEGLRLQINASNCVHCKTCDIMDPYQVIDWVPPEGGDGPEYRYL